MVISVSGLGKAYPVRQGPWVTLGGWFGLTPPQRRWVFRGLDFTIGPGQAVGIIGANGAGKSTLLKVLTGTALATEGEARVEGRVSALLELGMGFHPDFTGRQNVFLAGQMLGLARPEIAALVPEIQEFAEIGDYFDQPVRTYSSGMFVRLAFSVATAVRPEVLIVDEALAVGDIYFQHKSFARIRRFKEEGTTLLFVSHDPGAVKSLCDRALLLGDGRLLMDGDPDDVLDYYTALIAERENRHELVSGGDQFQGRSGNGKARIDSVEILGEMGEAQALRVGDAATLRIRFTAHEILPDLVLGMLIKDRTGYDIYGINTHQRPHLPPLGDRPGQPRTLDFRIPALNLGAGSYSVTVALHSHADHLHDNYDWWERALVFQIVPNHRHGHFVGVTALQAEPSMEETAS
ncbi:ABC transporter ATP-binding protein [Denitratisoma oestradiolicum]|uniref:ABC transporter ATP-binding protein n=1 Tax=Denitratisoma oestradiolicum TaxID=311182 RepID=A0A6S6Y3E6_9PROT|nr:ABC transporter ATP-binding protein [Denitratisoma oestradiolicum]TWO80681.1 sugar ABC transporter ATP-binding protein [Denitratisoma oestradiolicum]CAB1371087.1 ABC transporter ATP-binding protein [Denitratisoma oestradiolicum]